MPEYSKILITALSSFAIGIISEPVRLTMTTLFQAKKLRRALYIELGMLHKRLAYVDEDNHRNAELLRSFTFRTYNYAKTLPGVFYSLSEAVTFDELYGWYDFAIKVYSKDDDDVIKFSQRLLTVINHELSVGGFNDDLLREVSPEYLDYKETT